jgi:hypothetical protein
MIFLARGKKGVGYFKIIEVGDSARGYIFKGVNRIRRGDRIRECPNGVRFLYLTLSYAQFRAEIDDTIRYPYGIFSSMKIGRKYQFALDGGFGFGHIFYPIIGFSFTPVYYFGEDLGYGLTLGGMAIFAFQRWRSDDGEVILRDTTGIAMGFGLAGMVGAVIRYDLGRYHLCLEGYYPFTHKIDNWKYSRTVNGESQWVRVPDSYLTHTSFRLRDLIIKVGIGYNFEVF